MPALGGEGKHEVFLYPADKAHDGEDAVVNLEVVAEEGDNKKPFNGDMNTLGEFVISCYICKLKLCCPTQNIS